MWADEQLDHKQKATNAQETHIHFPLSWLPELKSGSNRTERDENDVI